MSKKKNKMIKNASTDAFSLDMFDDQSLLSQALGARQEREETKKKSHSVDVTKLVDEIMDSSVDVESEPVSSMIPERMKPSTSEEFHAEESETLNIGIPDYPAVRLINDSGFERILFQDKSGASIVIPVATEAEFGNPDQELLGSVMSACIKMSIISGCPMAVYESDELIQRLNEKRITHFVPSRVALLSSNAMPEYVLAYYIPDSYTDQWDTLLEELPSDILATTLVMSYAEFDQHRFIGFSGIEAYIVDLLHKVCTEEAKDRFEDLLIKDMEEFKNYKSLMSEVYVQPYDELVQTLIGVIAGSFETDEEEALPESVKDIDDEEDDADWDDDDEEVDEDEEPDDSLGKMVMRFAQREKEDALTRVMNDVKSEKEEGVQNDNAPFPERDADASSERVSGSTGTASTESAATDEHGRDNADSGHIRETASEEKGEEAEETEAESDGWNGAGYRPELFEGEEETEEEEAGSSDNEIAEVDPKTFQFEEEGEEDDSMVIPVMRG